MHKLEKFTQYVGIENSHGIGIIKSDDLNIIKHLKELQNPHESVTHTFVRVHTISTKEARFSLDPSTCKSACTSNITCTCMRSHTFPLLVSRYIGLHEMNDRTVGLQFAHMLAEISPKPTQNRST